MSTGRAIAEWLNDTVEAANYMAVTLERARAAPKLVASEIHAYALGLADETGDIMKRVQAMAKDEAKAWGEVKQTLEAATDAPIPPSCNTGGKVTPKTIAKKGNKNRFPLPPAMVQAYADTNGIPPKGAK